MFKKQKSKILVFLLMLGLLYGCKRQILDPLNPQNNLPQKAQFDKAKGFYENGRYKNQPKRASGNGNERMSAQDSARFKDFEPQWDKTDVELLPNNEKMLIVPVVRYLSVNYDQSIGFIRRLCIRVDANEDFLEANIVELVGNLTFVKANYNAIFKNYKSNSVVSGFDGVIIVRELDYDLQNAKFYHNGTFKENTQIQQQPDSTTQHAYTCIIYDTVWFASTCSNIGVNGHTGYFCGWGSHGYWQTTGYFSTCYSDSGGGGSGSGSGTTTGTPGQTGGGGSGGSSGSPKPPKPPKPKPRPPTLTPPFPGMYLGDDMVWYFPDGGVSWGEGEGVPENEPEDVITNIDGFAKIVDYARTDTTNADIKDAMKEFNRLYNTNCSFKCVVDKLANARPNGVPFKMAFTISSTMGNTGGLYNPTTQTLQMNYAAFGGRGFTAMLHEETLHAYQWVFDRSFMFNITPANNFTGTPNIEFDAKLNIDIENFIYFKKNKKLLHVKQWLGNMGAETDSYKSYIKAITVDGTRRPITFANLSPVGHSYAQWLQNFKDINVGKPYDKPIVTNKTPFLIVDLGVQCPCN